MMIEADRTSRPFVLVFRDDLLRPSETFILAQGNSLRRYRPVFAGSRRVPGISVSATDSVVLDDGTLVSRLERYAFKLARRAPRFERRLRSWSPSLVHAHFGPDALRILPTARRLDIPLVATFHGFDATTRDEWARRSFFGHRMYVRHKAELYQQAALIIAISEHIRDALLQQGFPPEKVRVLYTGVDLTYFRRSQVQQPRGGVLFVGRLIEVKGCEYVIRAMAPLQERYPELMLTIVGDGPLKPKLEELAARVLRRVEFRGTLPQAEVRSLLERTRVVCGPSITATSGASEGLGMIFLEAQAMGVPVAGFSCGGISEAVQHETTGLLVAERDWRGLSESIERLVCDETLHARLSRNATNFVRERFDIVRQTELLETFYDELVTDRRPSSRAPATRAQSR